MEGIYLIIQIRTNIPSLLCTKEGWQKADGAGLLLPQQAHSEEQLPFTPPFPTCQQAQRG